MSWFYYYVLATLALVTISAFFMAFYFRKKLTNMASMTISMAIGMNIGLTAGLLFGSLYQGNLYFSTMISILIGITAGLAGGFGFGIMSVVEGFMAGLMGGMMGAMLGAMITQGQAEILINILLTLSVSCLILFPILRSPLEKTPKNNGRKWLIKPLLTFLLLSAYMLFGNQLDKIWGQSESNISDDNSHANHGSQDPQQENNLEKMTVSIPASRLSYDPKKIILQKDQQVTLLLNNLDSIEHDIEIKQFPMAEKIKGQYEGLSENGADFHLHAPAKNKTELTFTPVKEGLYQFYCTIPGHKENGMTGIIIVK